MPAGDEDDFSVLFLSFLLPPPLLPFNFNRWLHVFLPLLSALAVAVACGLNGMKEEEDNENPMAIVALIIRI